VDAGTDTITDLGFGGTDALIIAAGAAANATLAANWAASAGTSNAGAASLIAFGFNVDLGAVSGASGWSVSNDGATRGVRLVGTGNADTLTGGLGNDTIIGGAGVDILVGGDGSDQLTGGLGDDVMTGGLGIDRFMVNLGVDRVTDLGRGGGDVLIVSVGATGNADLAADWVASGGSANSGVANLSALGFDVNLSAATGSLGWNVSNAGTGDAVILTGSARADRLTGGGANDTLSGGAGNDTLDGGAGADRMTGGPGNDVFRFVRGEAQGDTVTDFVGNGALVGDRIEFSGYGTAALGASFTQVTATTWRVSSADGLTQEVVTFANSASIHTSDWSFV